MPTTKNRAADKSAPMKPSERARAFLVRFRNRLGVHFCSWIAAFLIGSGAIACNGRLMGGVVIAPFIGLICLFPRGNPREPSWYLPTAFGVIEAVVLAVLGVPWQLTVFFSGLVTWLMRLILSKGRFGWEWTVLPFLTAYFFFSRGYFATLAVSQSVLWSIPVVVAAGVALAGSWITLRSAALRRKAFDSAVSQITQMASDPALSETLRRALLQLSKYAAAYRPLLDFKKPESEATTAELSGVCEEVRALPAPSSAPGAAESMRQKAEHTLFEGVRGLNDRVVAVLRRHNAWDDGLGMYDEFVRELRFKKGELPAELAAHVEGIAETAAEMLSQMRSDPNDVSQGRQFLNRYHKATLSIIEEYLRLKDTPDLSPQMQVSLEQSPVVLERLHQAFRDELKSLLQNDSISFSAELQALDTLLKMHGR